jgi:hypothetical protein
VHINLCNLKPSTGYLTIALSCFKLGTEHCELSDAEKAIP